ANKALARLVGSGKQLPNQSILLNSIVLQEAKLSSEIENIITTNDELYQAFASEKKVTDLNTKEVLHYQEALWEGFESIKKHGIITTNLIISLCNIIKETDSGIRKTTGTKISNHKTGDVIYTPPEGEAVIRKLLHNLERYVNLNDDGVDPLIKMAVIHYQFEAIHPFTDGNGRTGRILNILYLVKNNLLEIPILYLSRYIMDHKAKYYTGLRNVTDKNDWRDWILYVLDGVEQTALYTQNKIDSIIELQKEINEEVKKKLPDIYSKELVEIIFRQPYCKRKFLEDAKLVKKKTAGVYLSELERIGVFKSEKVGKEKLYINKRLFDILKK
ncbi:MAG TPA: addiction module protein, partial [Bacteroidetes bacterium]|nr:addiction module protein [Bacteroidota bacterium]